MKHFLLPHHLKHTRKIGVPIPSPVIDMSNEEYAEHYTNWKRTLPKASHEELHKHVLAHGQWHRHAHKVEEKKVIAWEHRAIVALFVLVTILIFSTKARCQFSHINTVQIQQAGTTVSGGFIAYPFSLNFNTNLTVTCSGGVCTVNATGGSGTGCVPPGTHINAFLIDSGTGTCPDFGGFSASAHNFVTGLSNAGVFSAAQPAFTDISGSWGTGQAPASANSCATHQFTISLASGFNVTCAQPVAADIGSIPGSNGQLLFNNSGVIGAEDPVISYNNPSETTAAWTSATANNTALSVTLPVGTGVLSTVMVTLNQGSTITGGVVSFLASDTTGLTNTYPVYCIPQGASTGPVSSYTLTASTNIAFQCSLSSFEAFEVKLSPAISGTATVNVGIQPTSAPSQAQVAVVNFPATQAVSGTVSVSNFPATQPVSGTVTANAGTGQFNVTCTAANCPINEAQVSGTAVSVNNGTTDAGTTRVTLSSDGTGQVKLATGANTIGALTANQSVNLAQVAGTNTVTDGTAGVQAVGGHLSDNGAAAASNRMPILPGIYQTTPGNGTAGTQGRDTAIQVGTDGLAWTASLPARRPASYYTSTGAGGVASAASATDIAVITGNATTDVLITKVKVSCTETTAGVNPIQIVRRSTADTLGTTQSMTIGKDDTSLGAASATVTAYTANPTTGNLDSTIDAYALGCMASATASPNDIYILNRQQKPIVLIGTAAQLAVNLNAATVTGGKFFVTFEWIEETHIAP